MNLRFLSVVLMLGLACIPTASFAVSSSSINISVVPENPKPAQDVSISLQTYAADLDSAPISWFVNGKSAGSGTGRKSFSFKAPASGAETRVSVKIIFPDGENELSITVRPSNMVLLWQADDSYVPPFYKGKALPARESQIRVVAMPEVIKGGTFVNPKSMTYSWKLDYQNEQDGSGYGKNYFIYTSDYLENTNNVSVVASTTDQLYSTEANVNISAAEPKIVFYRNDSKLGTLWENAIAENHRIEGDEVIDAAPYFISPKNLFNPILQWGWYINESPVPVGSIVKNLLPVKVQDGASGSSKVHLEI